MHRNIKSLIVLVVCLFVITVVLSGCKLKKEDNIVFDDTYPLALAPDINWAVVVDPYAAYRVNYGWNESGEGHCRKGEILQIIGKEIDKNREVWYFFEDGWLPANSISVFDNRYKAEFYSKQITK